MKIYTKLLKLETKKEVEFTNITDKLKEIISNCKIKEGFVIIFSKHTTFAIKINEDESLLLKDMTEFMQELVPKDKEYLHDKIELREGCPPNEPKNGDGHIKNLLLESSQTIPIINGKLSLGKWQSIMAIETSGPRERKIIVQVYGK